MYGILFGKTLLVLCILLSDIIIIGGDVVFSCRDEGLLRAPVRWVREGGRPLRAGSTDRNGRLEMVRVTVSFCQIII